MAKCVLLYFERHKIFNILERNEEMMSIIWRDIFNLMDDITVKAFFQKFDKE